jgi:PAS domain S-box-containing protein
MRRKTPVLSRAVGFICHVLPWLGMLVVGTLLSVVLFTVLRSLETKNAQTAFNGVAQERLDALETNVTLTINHLVSLGAFCDALHDMQRAEFHRFATPLLARHRAIQALEWIPRVPKRSRQKYEEAARRDGFPAFQVTERLSPARLAKAGERDEYFPVYIVEPLQGNEKALGFDLASDPVRRQAIERSADSGRLVATSRIKLVQETSDQYGFLVFRPVYRGGIEPASIEARREALTGFALAVFRVSDIVEKATDSPTAPSGLKLAIFDCDAKPGEGLLYPKGAPLKGVEDLPGGFRAIRTAVVAGRTWELAAYPVSNSFRPVRWSSWVTLLASLLLTFLLTAYLAERKRAEDALEGSEERYRSLVCNLPEVVWTMDAEGRFAFIGPNIERLSGFNAQEIYAQGSRPFFACLHADDLDKVRQGLQALFARGQPYNVEYRVRRRSGEWIWVRDIALTTYERKGVRYADGLLSDITGLKRVEQRLRVQYDTARALTECSTLDEAAPTILQSLCRVLGWDHAVLWGVDREANVLRWVKCWHAASAALAELEAVQRQVTFAPGTGVAGSVWSSGQAIWIEDISALDGYIKGAANRGLRTAVTFPVVSGGVVLTVMQLFSQEVVQADDQVLQMLMAIADQVGPLIERQRAEEALQASEERARLLFATFPHPAYVFDTATLDFLEVNDAAMQQYGYSRDEFLRMKTTDIRPAEEVERFNRHLNRVKAVKGAAGQWKHLTKDGRILDVEVHFGCLDYDGRRARLAIAQDVTDRNRLELELRHAQKLEAVGSLAAGIAHEMNTPIQFVGDNVRFLKDAFTDLTAVLQEYRHIRDQAAHDEVARGLAAEVADAEKAADLGYLLQEIPKAIEQSLDGVTRVATIVRAMKEFAHPGCKEKAAADLNRALANALIVTRNEIKYVADVETEFGELPPVRCHIADLNQVFLNLLINAADAIRDVAKPNGPKGLIRVTTGRNGDRAVISISDTGGGIPAEIRNRVFDPFFTTKEVGRGSGQGLAIARTTVVEKHGGSIRFEPNGTQGTTFVVSLPIEPTLPAFTEAEDNYAVSRN